MKLHPFIFTEVEIYLMKKKAFQNVLLANLSGCYCEPPRSSLRNVAFISALLVVKEKTLLLTLQIAFC
jgi:hypothetical protein